MKPKKCRNKQCKYNQQRIIELEKWGVDYRQQIKSLEDKLKLKLQNDQEQLNWMKAKQQLVQVICVIVGVRATNAYLKVTKGPYKDWLFTAELIYNDQCYKALPKYSS